MAEKKIVKTVRVDALLAKRIESYCISKGMKEADAIRFLLEQGLACESLNVFATPVGSLIRNVIEAEFALMRQEMEEHETQMEERVARVVSRGAKASLQTAAQLNDISRSIIPAWGNVKAEDLWKFYSKIAGKLQSGTQYSDAKKDMQ